MTDELEARYYLALEGWMADMSSPVRLWRLWRATAAVWRAGQ